MIGNDTIDTCDIEERIEELEEVETEYLELFDEYFETMSAAAAAQKACDESGLDRADRVELQKLRQLREELQPYCDWHHGETLIHASYCETYAKELADDLGVIDRKAGWPLQHIDWASAADELFSSDYTSADIDGHTYFVRLS